MLIPPEEKGNETLLCVLKNLIQTPKANKGEELRKTYTFRLYATTHPGCKMALS